MEFIKKHPIECILTTIFITIFLSGAIAVFMMWNQSSGSVYGNRLDGIEEVKIKSEKFNEIETELKKNAIFTSVKGKIEGRIINCYLNVNKGTNKEEAKTAANVISTLFSEKELEYYDLQVFIDESEKLEDSVYPVIGYKSKKSKNIIWTNNR